MVTFGALQMLGSSATPQWSAIAIDLVDARFRLTIVVMLLGGAFGGVSYELLLRGRVKTAIVRTRLLLRMHFGRPTQRRPVELPDERTTPHGTRYNSAMPNRIVHFEIEAADRERAKQFYAQAFGWELQQMGQDMGEYVVVITGDPKEPGGINGGIFGTPPGAAKELNAYSCVVAVDNIDESTSKVKSAGGQVMGDKMDIPGVGTFIRCKDTEGNIFTMLQPLPTSA
jgi:uncharacterized protein